MGIACPICRSTDLESVFDGETPRSVTSTGAMLDQRLQVYVCAACGHGMNHDAGAVRAYHCDGYHRTIAESLEPMVHPAGGSPVPRGEFIASYLQMYDWFGPRSRILEYGALKAEMACALHRKFPQMGICVYGTSHYQSAWSSCFDADAQAAGTFPTAWSKNFDVVVSNFELAHSSDPQAECREMAAALKPGGWLCVSVPDPVGNIGDILVANHVNHFSPASLRRLLTVSGFTDITIDRSLHGGRLIASARCGAHETLPPPDIPPEGIEELRELGASWRKSIQNLQRFEIDLPDRETIAIFGAGFYGGFALASLARPERVAAFLDSDARRAGQSYLGRPIELPTSARGQYAAVIAGLSPTNARPIVEKSGLLTEPATRVFFF